MNVASMVDCVRAYLGAAVVMRRRPFRVVVCVGIMVRASQFELSEKSEIMRYVSWATEAFLPRESWMRRISFRAG